MALAASDAGVLLIGAGGLGCATALGLAAAGVKRIGVVDDDVVDETNLHRQVLHTPARVGMRKTASLSSWLQQRFPEVEVVEVAERFSAANAAALVSRFAVLVDGSDNLFTKFLANDAAVLASRPLIHAAAVGTMGQLTSVAPGGRPCYRCFFEELPAPDAEAPSCAEAGVLGPVPGVLGALQAAEAVRFLRGEPPAFVGRLLQYDAPSFSFRTVRFRRNPTCAVCGDRPTIHNLAQLPAAPEAC
ncbi:MAG TPA: HesA/MoeB/ThiF family protein [Polyangia bacterium]